MKARASQRNLTAINMTEYHWFRSGGGEKRLLVKDGSKWRAYDATAWSLVSNGDDAASAAASLATFLGHQGNPTLVRAHLGPGEFNPRMWRGQLEPRPWLTGHEGVWREARRVQRMLAARLQGVFNYLEPEHVHDSAYGHELRLLLIAACTEVEAGWNSVLTAHGALPSGRNPTRADYVRLAAPMKLASFAVELTTNRGYGRIEPFSGWGSGGTLHWYDAYNATKHDREANLVQATLGHVISALAGSFVMTVAQFGEVALDRHDHFPAEEFVVVTVPQWPDEEMYVPPQVGSVASWRAVVARL